MWVPRVIAPHHATPPGAVLCERRTVEARKIMDSMTAFLNNVGEKFTGYPEDFQPNLRGSWWKKPTSFPTEIVAWVWEDSTLEGFGEYSL